MKAALAGSVRGLPTRNAERRDKVSAYYGKPTGSRQGPWRASDMPAILKGYRRTVDERQPESEEVGS